MKPGVTVRPATSIVPARRGGGQVAHSGDVPAGNAYVGGEGGTAGAVDHRAAAENGVKHGFAFLFPLPAGAG